MDTAAFALARDNGLPIIVFNIHEPDFGHLLDNMRVDEGSDVDCSQMIWPRVEPEVADHLGDPLRPDVQGQLAAVDDDPLDGVPGQPAPRRGQADAHPVLLAIQEAHLEAGVDGALEDIRGMTESVVPGRIYTGDELDADLRPTFVAGVPPLHPVRESDLHHAQVTLRYSDHAVGNGPAMFAEAWVESRHAGRGLAKRALAFELRRRGVEPAVVDDVVLFGRPVPPHDLGRREHWQVAAFRPAADRQGRSRRPRRSQRLSRRAGLAGRAGRSRDDVVRARVAGHPAVD